MPECQNCGNIVPEGNKFCPSCGAQMAEAPPVPPAGTPPQAPPPGTQQPPATPPPVPPPAPGAREGKPKKKGLSRGAKIAIALGALVVALIVVGVVLMVVFVVNVVSAPADVANAYVQALDEGDLSTAWDYLSASTKSDEGRPGFESKVEIFEGEISKWNTSSIEVNNSSAQVVMRMSFDDGSDATWDMYLIKEDGEWKIEQVSPRS